jgi:hypothetical protein
VTNFSGVLLQHVGPAPLVTQTPRNHLDAHDVLGITSPVIERDDANDTLVVFVVAVECRNE